jgi:hypothetical protein
MSERLFHLLWFLFCFDYFSEDHMFMRSKSEVTYASSVRATVQIALSHHQRETLLQIQMPLKPHSLEAAPAYSRKRL